MSRLSSPVRKSRAAVAAVVVDTAVDFPFPCALCPATSFPSARQLKEHQRARHALAYACNVCLYAAGTVAELITHAHRHRGTRPFLCAVCGHCFKSKDALKIHSFTHEPSKPFKCSMCAAQYTTRTQLRLHEQGKHRNEKPFQCPHCDYRSLKKESLVKHLRTHTGEKPFQCPLCTYRCAQKTTLDKHRCRPLAADGTVRAVVPTIKTAAQREKEKMLAKKVAAWTTEFVL
jgi:KRAB domain-containing zinc finger protein